MNQIGGVDITASPSDINNLIGVTADKNEINLLDGAIKRICNGKAVIYSDTGSIPVITTASQPNITNWYFI